MNTRTSRPSRRRPFDSIPAKPAERIDRREVRPGPATRLGAPKREARPGRGHGRPRRWHARRNHGGRAQAGRPGHRRRDGGGQRSEQAPIAIALRPLNTTDEPRMTVDDSPISHPDPVLEVDALTKTFSLGDIEVHALRGVNLTVERGEFIAIMGASGIGQVDPHEHPRLSRSAHERHLSSRWHRSRGRGRADPRPDPKPSDRLRLSELQSPAADERAREREPAALLCGARE